MTTLSTVLRAVADLVDAVPDGLEQPAVSIVGLDDFEASLQFDSGSVAAVEAWGALLEDAEPGDMDGSGYRQIVGSYQGARLDVWAPAPDYTPTEI